MSHTHEPYNHYTHRYEETEPYLRERRKKIRTVMLLFFSGLVLGGVIGFGVGISWPKSEQRQSVEHRVVTDHIVVYDHKTIVDKPSVKCSVIYDVSGDYKPYSVIQCSDGSMKVIRG